jgi:hypothetical protein
MRRLVRQMMETMCCKLLLAITHSLCIMLRGCNGPGFSLGDDKRLAIRPQSQGQTLPSSPHPQFLDESLRQATLRVRPEILLSVCSALSTTASDAWSRSTLRQRSAATSPKAAQHGQQYRHSLRVGAQMVEHGHDLGNVECRKALSLNFRRNCGRAEHTAGMLKGFVARDEVRRHCPQRAGIG